MARALAVLVLAALGGCSVARGGPDAPRAEPVRETRRSTHPGGALRTERQVLVYADRPSERDGFEREFTPAGRLVVERFFAHEVPHGTWREWHADGTPRSQVEFGAPGSQELLPSRYWHANGQLAAEGTCRAGVREGEWSYRDEAGRLLRRGAYRGGLRHGSWLFLRPDGSKEAEGRFEGGQRVGVWTLWDEQGQPHSRPGPTVEPRSSGFPPARR